MLERAGDHAQPRLEVHELQHAADQEHEVDAVEGIVPGQAVGQVLRSAGGGSGQRVKAGMKPSQQLEGMNTFEGNLA